MLTLQKLWAVQWVWPIIAYVFILFSEIRTNLSYGHPLIPRRPDKRGLTVLYEGERVGRRNSGWDSTRGLAEEGIMVRRMGEGKGI